MNSNELINSLNEYDIFEVLEDLQADPIMCVDHIEARTVCHNGEGEGSHKLYYYFDKKAWVCYTHHCKIGNIINLVMEVKNWEFHETFRYLCDKFGLIGDGESEELLDLKFFEKFKKTKEKYKYKLLDKNVLNIYYPFYHQTWIDDHITIEAMQKYNILFNVKNNRIIIPHYNLEGELIGVRRRNLLESEVVKGKYMPESYSKETYSHSLGNNIYGLNFQLNPQKTENFEKEGEIIACNRLKSPNLAEFETRFYNKSLILFEAEKSVLQLDGYKLGYIGGALCGSSLTDGQYKIIIDLINKYDIEEIIIAMDKEYEEDGDDLSEFYARRIRENMVNKLLPYVDVSVIWDKEGVLDYKDSPTDKGKEAFVKLLNTRIQIND